MMDGMAEDGLIAPIVGAWAEEKYRLVECYARIFATSMKRKWDARVYLDLFSGAGRATIRQRVVDTAALRVLSIPDPFDRYVFCELDSPKLAALKARVAATHPNRDSISLNIDSNREVERIVSAIQPPGAGRVLTFCFVDPFKIRHLDFQTIKRLADRFVDFLVLLPTGMDPGRNEEAYSRDSSTVVATFTGRPAWREDRANRPTTPFGDFVALQFGRSMQELKYLSTSLSDMQEVRNSKNRGMYRLAMFSRKPLANDFWEACRKATNQQRSFF